MFGLAIETPFLLAGPFPLEWTLARQFSKDRSGEVADLGFRYALYPRQTGWRTGFALARSLLRPRRRDRANRWFGSSCDSSIENWSEERAIFVCMNESASRNGTAPKATKPDRCQAKECSKFGSLRFIVHQKEKSEWSYFMCDEHFLLLRKGDKEYIARTLGTKVA